MCNIKNIYEECVLNVNSISNRLQFFSMNRFSHFFVGVDAAAACAEVEDDVDAC